MGLHIPAGPAGRSALRAKGAARGLVPLIDYLERHGCDRSAVYRRKDITRVKIDGIAYVPADAPAVKGRGGAQ